MSETEILDFLETEYPIEVRKIEFLRDSGSIAYAVYGENEKYFLVVQTFN